MQIDPDALCLYSTKGERDPRNQEEYGGRRILVQRPQEPAPKSALDNDQGAGDVTQDEVGRVEKLPTLESGTFRVAIGATEHGNNPTGNNREEIKPTEASKGMRSRVDCVGSLLTPASCEKDP